MDCRLLGGLDCFVSGRTEQGVSDFVTNFNSSGGREDFLHLFREAPLSMMYSRSPTEVAFSSSHRDVEDETTSTERPDTLSFCEFMSGVSRLSLELLLPDTRAGLHNRPSSRT